MKVEQRREKSEEKIKGKKLLLPKNKKGNKRKTKEVRRKKIVIQEVRKSVTR